LLASGICCAEEEEFDKIDCFHRSDESWGALYRYSSAVHLLSLSELGFIEQVMGVCTHSCPFFFLILDGSWTLGAYYTWTDVRQNTSWLQKFSPGKTWEGVPVDGGVCGFGFMAKLFPHYWFFPELALKWAPFPSRIRH
jgi:hypothetical protein